jgi:hypothetical protein
MIVLTGQRLGGLLWEGSSIRDEDNGELGDWCGDATRA